MGRLTSSNSGGRLSSASKSGRVASTKFDLDSVEGLQAYAKSVGLSKQANKIVNPPDKLSFLQRLGKGLGAFNPAEAILTGIEEKSVGKGLLEYPKRIVQGLGSLITGKDYGGTQRGFKEVAEKAGIQNKILKFGIGFLGDVLLDPTTYFGGAIAKGLVGASKAGTNIALKGIGRLAPATETGLRMAGTGVQDAFGRAFVAGYKSTKGAYDDVLSHLSTRSRKVMQSASDQLSNLGVKGLTEAQRLEVGLKSALGKQSEFLLGEQIGRTEATKLIREAQSTGDFSKLSTIDKDLAEKVNVKFNTPQQQEYFTKQQERVKDFAKIADIDDPYAVYFPFIKKQVKDKFVQDIQRTGIKVGSEGYAKQFKNILTMENIELDPAKSFFTRESQIISDTESRKFLQDFAGKYGKPLDEFASEAEARSAGFRVLKEKGGFGKSIGYVGEWDAKLFNDLIRPEFQTINMLAKATGFDAVTSLFKRSVTGLFLPFHVRNYISGTIQNFEVLGVGALNPKNIAMGQRIAYLAGKGGDVPNGLKDIVIAGKSTKFKDVLEPFMKRFSDDTFYNEDFDRALNAGQQLASQAKIFSKQSMKETFKTAGLGQNSIPFKAARAVGQFIEHQQKATAYVTALGQGKTIAEALKLAEKAGFDYRALTAFESQVMRRIMPFYSFTRKNIELQLKTLGENPQRINQVLAFFGNIGGELSDEEKKNLPDFIKDSLGVRLEDTPEGLKQYISTFGTPIEAFTQLFGKNPILRSISMTNPIIKVPVELGIGKDSFRQRDLKDVYDAKEYKNAPQVLKNLLEITPVERDVLKKGSDGKLYKTGKKTVYVANPEKLLVARSLFTSRGISYLDQVFGNDSEGIAKFVKVTSGIKAQSVDIEMQKSMKETQQKRELEDLLTKRADVRRYQTIYKPKK